MEVVYRMARTHTCWVFVLALGIGLFSGCGPAPYRSRAIQSPSARAGAREPARSAKKIAADPEQSVEAVAAAHAHYAAGVILDMQEETEAALEQYYQAAVGDPGNEELALEVSRRFLQNKQPEKALELLQRSAERKDASSEVLARLGMVYAQLGKTEEAVTACRAAIQKSPGALAGYQTLFVTYLQRQQVDEALKVVDQAAAQPRATPDFLVSLSELYVNFGMQVPARRESANAKAMTVLLRAEKMAPRATGLRLKLADGFNLLGDTTRATQIYLDLLKGLPDTSPIREHIHAKLADIYLRGKDRKRALEQLDAIVKADPTNPQAYYFLGGIALDEKKPADAIEYLRKTVLLAPGFEQAYYDLANAQLSANKPDEALATLADARARFPQNFVQELLSAMACMRKKDFDEALKHFTAAEVVAKASEPRRLNEIFYLQMGSAYERKGDFAEAEKYLQKVLELAPDFAEALNYLGYMWADRGVNLEKARELIEKAVKAEPKNGAYLDSLGWVLFKQGRPEEALAQILKAVDLIEEPDPTLFDHLGDIYVSLKQPDKAREAWRKSLALEPNEAVKKKLDALN